MGPTLDQQILNFLDGNRKSAYTPMEIVMELGISLRDAQGAVVDSTLEHLRGSNKVVGRWREEQERPQPYYAFP